MSGSPGLIHLYCGEGKGKTTACVGLAVRAAGRGKRVLFTQFLKDGKSGEISVLKKTEGITVIDGVAPDCFTFKMCEGKRAVLTAQNNEALRRAFDTARSEEADMLVLDECVTAVACGTLSEELLIGLAEQRPEGLELVMSGRSPSGRLVLLCDYVSEINKIKHPFDRGVAARDGIER